MTLFFVNVLLALLWVFLWGDLSLYTLLVGLVGGYLVLWIFTRVQGRRTLRDAYGQRMLNLLKFAVYFLKLLVVSNLQIAKEIVTPGQGMTPRFVRYEVTGMNDAQTTAFANAITLTPGTLVVDAREREDGRRFLYVHAMYAEDREAAVRGLDELRRHMERDVFVTRSAAPPADLAAFDDEGRPLRA